MQKQEEKLITTKIMLDTYEKQLHPSIDVHENIAYIGQYLPVNHTIQTKTDTIQKTIQKPCIINSNHEIQQINEKNQTCYDYTLTNPLGKMTKWKPQHIKQWLTETHTKPNIKQLHKNIKQQLTKHIDLNTEEEKDLLTCWIIGTYFHQCFQSYPMLYLNAPKRSGKSKLLTLSNQLSYNGILTVHHTPANLFRLTQQLRGTLHIDETENFVKGDFGPLRELLLCRYKKCSKIYRQEKNELNQYITQEFEVYGPTMIANINGIDDILEDRSIGITLKRTLNKSIANQEVDLDDEVWWDLRNQLYITYLSEYQTIIDTLIAYKQVLTEKNDENTLKQTKTQETTQKTDHSDHSDHYQKPNDQTKTLIYCTYNASTDDTDDNDNNNNNNVRSDNQSVKMCFRNIVRMISMIRNHKLTSLSGRNLELWLPIYIIGLCISDDVYINLLKLSDHCTNPKNNNDQSSATIEEVVLRTLKVLVKNKTEFSEPTQINYLTMKVNENLIDDLGGKDDVLTGRKVSSVLKRLGFSNRCRDANGYSMVRVSEGEVDEMCKRLDVFID